VCVCRLSDPSWKTHVLYYIAISGLSIFPQYLIKGTIFRKKNIEHKSMVLFTLHLSPETFLILRRIQQDIIINVHRYSCKVSVILVRF